MADTNIGWTNKSWNMIRARRKDNGKVGWHCVHKSEGCRFCFSEALNLRLGTGLAYKPGHEAEIEVYLDEDVLRQPLTWRKPQMIFPCSMTDLFGEFVTDEMLDKVFDTMERCPHHTFQVLTKRSGRMRSFMERRFQAALGRRDARLIPPNVWAGVSCENQLAADERLPDLVNTPAAVKWVSAEPLLARIDFRPWLTPCTMYCDHGEMWPEGHRAGRPLLDWIVTGGESGPGRREMDLSAAEFMADQCADYGVAFYFKQDSALRPGKRGRASDALWSRKQFPAVEVLFG